MAHPETPPAGVAPSPPRVEEREVRAADPQLSPETNARLTEELREVVGTVIAFAFQH